MDVAVEETGPVERRLRVELATAEVDAEFDRVYRELGRSARLKGFRPGHVPREVLERYFVEQARAEVLERVVRATLPRALEQVALEPITPPRLEPDEEPRAGTPFRYAVAVEIRPPIAIAQVKGLRATRPTLPEPEGDPVESYLEELRASHAELAAEPEGATAARGHVAVIDFEGAVDGRPFQGGSGKETALEIGGGAAIPGFDDALVGMAVGETREFELAVPESYPVPAVAGRSARFRVRLVELKRKELPELDDEFAKDVSEHATLDALRAELRGRVERGRADEVERRLREVVVDALIAANPFPVPPTLVEREVVARVARLARAVGGRVPDAELHAQIARWREELRPAAERAVRLALLAPEIARAEGIEIGEADLDARVRELAEAEKRPPGEVRRRLSEQGLLEALRAGLLEQRVVEFATSTANLSDG